MLSDVKVATDLVQRIFPFNIPAEVKFTGDWKQVLHFDVGVNLTCKGWPRIS